MIASNLPALQVVLPLLAAPLCVLLHHPRLTWGLAALTSFSTFAIAVTLLARVLADGPISYPLGSWAAPWGIEYRVDEVNAYVLLIVSAVSSVVLVFARNSVEREVEAERIYLLYTCWLLCLTGLLGMTVTGDAFNVFVFLEISSLSSYVLVSMSRDRRGVAAAYQYLVLGTIGATFILVGIGLLYQVTGTLNMADIAERLPASGNRTVTAAFGFFVVGLGLKAAVFPAHQWLPRAYAHAPSAVSAFLAATATKVAIYVLVRVALTVFGAAYVFRTLSLDLALAVVGCAGVLVGSAVAVFQTNLKLLLAYSSVGQIGYMVLGLAYASVTGLTATLVHLFNHALMKGALFMVVGCLAYRIGAVGIASLAGLGRRMPFTMAAFVAGGLSLIGVPLTAGFVSKWYLVLGAFERGWWLAVVVILVGSLLAIAYVWKVVEAAYFRPPATGGEAVAEAPWSLLAPAWVLVAGNVYFGIDTTTTVGVAARAAGALLGPGWGSGP